MKLINNEAVTDGRRFLSSVHVSQRDVIG